MSLFDTGSIGVAATPGRSDELGFVAESASELVEEVLRDGDEEAEASERESEHQ